MPGNLFNDHYFQMVIQQLDKLINLNIGLVFLLIFSVLSTCVLFIWSMQSVNQHIFDILPFCKHYLRLPLRLMRLELL